MRQHTFDLRLRPGGEKDLYLAQADSSFGDEGEELLEVPVDRFLKLGQRIYDQELASSGSSELCTEAMRSFGSELFKAFIKGNIAETFFSAMGTVRAKANATLRIRLRFSNEVPELAALPWEYIYRPKSDLFLSLSQKVSIVRYIDLVEPAQATPIADRLRILVLAASPKDQPRLHIEKHTEALKKAIHSAGRLDEIQISFLEEPSLQQLLTRLSEKQFHVLHFVGHGEFREETGQGFLMFEDYLSRTKEVANRELATVLRDHSSLRLAVLNACEGARSSSSDLFDGVAQSLIGHGVPSVIAMRNPIREQAAIQLTSVLYQMIARNHSLDRALTEARKALFVDGSAEWGIPAFFSRATEVRVVRIDGYPGHPFDYQLRKIEAAVNLGNLEDAAMEIANLELGRDKRLRHPTEALRRLKRAIIDHRNNRPRLDAEKLKEEIGAFTQELKEAV